MSTSQIASAGKHCFRRGSGLTEDQTKDYLEKIAGIYR